MYKNSCYLSKQEFIESVLKMEENLTIMLECEEGSTEKMEFMRVPFNGGVILYNSPMSNEVGILQDDGLGSCEENIEVLFDTLEQYYYTPFVEWNQTN